MKPVQAPATIIPDADAVDFSMLDEDDLVNLVLQRSETVRDRAAIRAWTEGDEAPLRARVRQERDAILASAFTRLGEVFATITPALDRLKPARLADIGAGYGFIDLLLFRRYGSDVILIDIEESENRHFGFAAEGAGYSSLAKARDFLVANGVPEARIRTLNPRHEDPGEVGEVDLAMSLISCGFHYPASTYDAFFANNVAPMGGILLDIRKGSGGIPYLKKFGRTTVLAQEGKAARVYTQKTVV
ncbi:MAG: hypothetical protein D6811_07245 [Alphaproteobacteria bacterium]|nr:MAG: hypothetical protein D6811_07245 [Alphaproteobacteria bacterium]